MGSKQLPIVTGLMPHVYNEGEVWTERPACLGEGSRT